MGKIIIQPHTTQNPITMIGEQAGICYGANTQDGDKNYTRGLDCLSSNHGRTFEFPDVYMILDGYSARVIREWYTHLGGMPTRLQASTRYINYQKGFDYIIPKTINDNPISKEVYVRVMDNILNGMQRLVDLDIPKEDIAMCLPLGMSTKIVCKHNLRNLIDMAQQRKCTRAYWEYRELFKDIEVALSEYSSEWKYLIDNYFKVKCDVSNICTEKFSCGRKPTKDKLLKELDNEKD